MYGTGLNIKGQLGVCHFENVNSPRLVLGLLPFGENNSKADKPSSFKLPKSPIVDVLESWYGPS